MMTMCIIRRICSRINYNFTDELRVTDGIRYTWDKRPNRHNTNTWRVPAEQQTCVVGPNAKIPNTGDDCNEPETVTFKYPAWTAGIDYRITPEIFVYVKTSGVCSKSSSSTERR